MLQVNTYLNFDGNAEEAFKFYQSVFGGELNVMRMGDSPQAGNVAADEKNRAMHIALPMGTGCTLMASDILPSVGHKLTVGNNYYISLHPDSEAETRRLFNSLSAGGKVEMPLEKMFWGAWFAAFADKFGVQWMINFDENQQA